MTQSYTLLEWLRNPKIWYF